MRGAGGEAEYFGKVVNGNSREEGHLKTKGSKVLYCLFHLAEVLLLILKEACIDHFLICGNNDDSNIRVAKLFAEGEATPLDSM